jgi:hypothetical protein
MYTLNICLGMVFSGGKLVFQGTENEYLEVAQNTGIERERDRYNLDNNNIISGI